MRASWPVQLRRGAVPLRDGACTEWLQLGDGALPVVVVPGAGDGLWTVGQTPLQLAWRFRGRLRSHRLLIISRREPIPPRFDAKRHADDYVYAVERLGWVPSVWECISAGGPIGQWAAQRRSDLVRGLILASTTHRSDERLRAILEHWRRLAVGRQWRALYWSIAELNDRRSKAFRHLALRPLLGLLPPPCRPRRFVRLLDGLVALDTGPILSEIACPTLVIGGEEDRIIGAGLQREMAALIPNSRLILYPGYGHSVPIEHPDYERVTRRFVEDVAGR